LKEEAMKRVVLLLVVLVIAGCGPWLRTEGPYVSDSLNFAVDLPTGWMRQNNSNLLLITRDGVLLQKIVASRLEIGKEKQFAHTKKRVSAGMLPQEAADVVLDDFQSDQGIIGFAVEENAPATVGGVPGFKARFAYKTKDGLKYQCVYYGALSGGYLYSLFYAAPARHYYAADLDAFEQMVRTFRLLKS
jgi:hypothetical protein